MQQTTSIPFSDHCTSVQHRIEQTHGIRIVTRDILDPLTGDLDGLEIHIDHAVTAEERLFLLAHLFGHTVQWNVNPRALEIGKLHRPPVAPALLADVIEYEREAAAYGLALLHEAGITDIDAWYSDYTACDMAYLRHYYKTGERRTFRSFWRDGRPLIIPLPYPSFTPSRRAFRGDGLVI